MFFNKIIYLFIESFKSIIRAIVPSIVSSLTIAVSLSILSISYYFYDNLRNYTSEFKDEYKIEVFFLADSYINEAIETYNKILLIDGIKEGAFIDKETAANFFKEEFNEDIEKIIGMNPLPMGAIYGISDEYRDYEKMSIIVEGIKRIPNVDDALFSQEAIIKLDKVIRNILSISFILGIFIVLIAVFFVSNTILLIIHSKKDEINTMKLLGATNLFIKTPYIIKGFCLGLLGSVISLILLICMYKFSIYIMYPYYEIPPISLIDLFMINLLIGPLFGIIGSVRALGAYVKK